MDQAPAKEVVVEKAAKCEGGDCDNDAGTLQCPTCQKLGKTAFFCSQDCFKRNWVGQWCSCSVVRQKEQKVQSLDGVVD